MAEQYLSSSPYHFAGNNPISNLELNGHEYLYDGTFRHFRGPTSFYGDNSENYAIGGGGNHHYGGPSGNNWDEWNQQARKYGITFQEWYNVKSKHQYDNYSTYGTNINNTGGYWVPVFQFAIAAGMKTNENGEWVDDPSNDKIVDIMRIDYEWVDSEDLDPDILEYYMGQALNLLGFLSSAGEYNNISGNNWKGKNGVWYPLRWGGNKQAGGKNIVIKTAKDFNTATRYFFYIGAILTIDQGVSAYKEGDQWAYDKATLDLTMAIIGTFGGEIGWIVSGIYFTADAMGAFDVHLPYNPTSNYGIQDNLIYENKKIIP